MTAALRAQIPIPPAPGMSNTFHWHPLDKSAAAWGLQLESVLVEQQVPGGGPYTSEVLTPEQISATWMGLEQPGHPASC